LNGEVDVEHVIVTSGAGPVVGKLIRWVWADGEVGYEARIDGIEDSGGISDVAAFSVDSLAARMCPRRSAIRVALPTRRPPNRVDVQLRVTVAE
jgi:hypothetical protein